MKCLHEKKKEGRGKKVSRWEKKESPTKNRPEEGKVAPPARDQSTTDPSGQKKKEKIAIFESVDTS